MANAVTYYGDVTIIGGLYVTGTLVLPSGYLSNTHIAAAAAIATSKLDHRHTVQYEQPHGTAVTAETKSVHICRAAGTIIAVEAAITGAIATDASRHVTVDVQKSTGGGAFATVLSAVLDFTSSSTVRVLSAATVTGGTLADGDILEVVVAVSGGSGTQAQGLVVTITLDESYAA